MRKKLILFGFFAMLAVHFNYGQKKVTIGDHTFILPKKTICTFEDWYDDKKVTYNRYLDIKGDTVFLYSLRYADKKLKDLISVEVTTLPFNQIDFANSIITQNTVEDELCGYTVEFKALGSHYFPNVLYTKTSTSEPGKLIYAYTSTENGNMLYEVHNKKLSNNR